MVVYKLRQNKIIDLEIVYILETIVPIFTKSSEFTSEG